MSLNTFAKMLDSARLKFTITKNGDNAVVAIPQNRANMQPGHIDVAFTDKGANFLTAVFFPEDEDADTIPVSHTRAYGCANPWWSNPCYIRNTANNLQAHFDQLHEMVKNAPVKKGTFFLDTSPDGQYLGLFYDDADSDCSIAFIFINATKEFATLVGFYR